MYGTLLIQYLNARKSVNLDFSPPKLQYQTINFFVLDVSQVTIAKMDIFSLLQMIEKFLNSGASTWDPTPLIKYLN